MDCSNYTAAYEPWPSWCWSCALNEDSSNSSSQAIMSSEDEDPNGWLPTIKESGGRESSIDINFVLRMISRANKYYTPDLLHQANRRLSKTTDSRKVKNSKH